MSPTISRISMLLFFCAFLSSLSPLFAQQPQPPYERILVPVLGSVSGAYGSIWKTEFTGHNDGDAAVDVTSCPLCPSVETPLMAPHASFVPQVVPAATRSGGGMFVYVGAAGAGKVTFNLRV